MITITGLKIVPIPLKWFLPRMRRRFVGHKFSLVCRSNKLDFTIQRLLTVNCGFGFYFIPFRFTELVCFFVRATEPEFLCTFLFGRIEELFVIG